ncbi:divergent PAP2 family protein [Lacticigenium naphthae]|uniref:divergent PAP2 family protein n=1 Tax=Lacticigenium naphthae TaxID=515351 RepID=UPI0004010157|nr:divergent PAP2 family protein [Lacticigenium naphthae]
MSLFSNYPLFSAFFAIIFSQLVKVPVAYLMKKQTSFALATSTGGMPSSHSAGVSALITALTVQHGIASPFVAIAATFGVIVIFDSMGVRRQSGEHGILLNELVLEIDTLRKKVVNLSKGAYAYNKEEHVRQLKEYLGHKPIEVFFGILTGIVIALVIHWSYLQLNIPMGV